MYEKIRYWYTHGLWMAAMVQNAVEKKVLTQEEASRIINVEETK